VRVFSPLSFAFPLDDFERVSLSYEELTLIFPLALVFDFNTNLKKSKKTGVVPLSAATLPGALNVILDGVFHAPRRSASGGEGGNAPGEERARVATSAARWFGEEAVIDSWLSALVKSLEE